MCHLFGRSGLRYGELVPDTPVVAYQHPALGKEEPEDSDFKPEEPIPFWTRDDTYLFPAPHRIPHPQPPPHGLVQQPLGARHAARLGHGPRI